MVQPVAPTQPMQPSDGTPRSGRRRLPRPGRIGAALAILGMLLLLILPASFAGAQNGQSDDEASPAASPAAGTAPAGEYTVALTDDDVPQDMVGGPDLIGRWQIFFESGGSYSMSRADVGGLVTGSWEADGDTITITDEGGLLSCINSVPTGGPEVPVETATYTWKTDGSGLTLAPVEEGCQARKIILSTRKLDVFVECITAAFAVGGTPQAATPEPAATPATDDEGKPIIENPFGGGESDEGDEGEISQDDAEAGIDDLLGQLSACWATQDAARIIPLFGTEFLNALIDQTGSIEDVIGIFEQLIVVPIVWERSGPAEVNGATASAVVAIRIGSDEQFQRFDFVFEDGQWKLDNFGVGN